MITLYGIPNCDTVKKARAWLDARGVAHCFHDFRKDGLDAARLTSWTERLGWEALLNRGGMTFRRLPEQRKADLDVASAVALMLDQPAMIRRPVVEDADRLLVGFKPVEWEQALAA